MAYEGYNFIDPRNVRSKSQLEKMKRLDAAGKDLFDPEFIEQPILFRTDHWYVTPNVFPYEGAECHFLVISLHPIYSVEDMSPEMWEDLGQIWQKLIAENDIQGGGLCIRFGDTLRSGATLTRLHAHLIEPEEGQKIRVTIGGNKVEKAESDLKE